MSSRTNRLKTDSWFGYAIVVDVRKFSTVCRNLLIMPRRGKDTDQIQRVNDVKTEIYGALFAYLAGVVRPLSFLKDPVFLPVCKHTGDGFLFVTNTAGGKVASSIDLLFNLYCQIFSRTVLLNTRVRQILRETRREDIDSSPHLKAIQRILVGESGLDCSIGCHKGRLFYQEMEWPENLVLGHCINLASRLQSLSKTFSDYKLFVSDKVADDILKKRKVRSEWPEPECMKKLEIRGIGPIEVHGFHHEAMHDLIKMYYL